MWDGRDVLPGGDWGVYRACSPEVVRSLARRFQPRSGSAVDSVALGALDLDAAHQGSAVVPRFPVRVEVAP